MSVPCRACGRAEDILSESAKLTAMKPLLTLWLLFWLALPGLAKPLCLKLELVQDKAVEGTVTPGQPQILRVVLTSDYLEIEDMDGRVVHDFVSRQSHLVSGEDYVRRSLYADIGFRVAETANRLRMLEAVRQANPSNLQGEEVIVEHLFGIDDETTEANISKTEGATLSYGHKGSLLAEFSAKGRPLTPEKSKEFVRFLRYYCGGHPDILSDVQVRAILPDTFRIDVSNVTEVVSYRFRVLDAEDCDPPHPDFSALRPTVLPPEPLGTLVALGLQLAPRAAEDAAVVLQARADQARLQGAMLEAALGYFEVLLMRGGEPPKALSEAREAFNADPLASQLFEGLLAGQQDPARSAAMCQALEGKVPGKDHVLKIFRAGMLMAQGQSEPARDLYLQALAVNPAIAGAWKDLGDLYHSDFQMDKAWLCWDVGRRLSPNHQMLADITKLEAALRSNYPGFF